MAVALLVGLVGVQVALGSGVATDPQAGAVGPDPAWVPASSQERTGQGSGKKAAVRAARRADRAAERVSRQVTLRLDQRQTVARSLTVRRTLPPPEPLVRKPEPPTYGPFSVRIGTFNVLGSQHTAPGGDRRNFPPASVRSVAAANLIAKHGLDIVGTQELQADQLRALQGRTGMAAYPGFSWGEAETDNSILYDAGVFELVEASQFTITFMGRARPQPIVRLRHRATGSEFYVVNTHPSAGGGVYLAERRRGQATLVSVVNNLKATGLPVLVTGDMNDREDFYCQVVPRAGLSAPNGGSYSAGCRPPPSPLPVDWVVGSGVTWSGYWRDTTPVDQRTSDHFIISATANVG